MFEFYTTSCDSRIYYLTSFFIFKILYKKIILDLHLEVTVVYIFIYYLYDLKKCHIVILYLILLILSTYHFIFQKQVQTYAVHVVAIIKNTCMTFTKSVLKGPQANCKQF